MDTTDSKAICARLAARHANTHPNQMLFTQSMSGEDDPDKDNPGKSSIRCIIRVHAQNLSQNSFVWQSWQQVSLDQIFAK